MTSELYAAIDSLAEAIANDLGIPKCDEMQMAGALRDALAEVRALADAADHDEEDFSDAEELAEPRDVVREQDHRLDRLRDELARAAGLPDWRWRKLPPEIADLLEYAALSEMACAATTEIQTLKDEMQPAGGRFPFPVGAAVLRRDASPAI
jgi:hypothetical protein